MPTDYQLKAFLGLLNNYVTSQKLSPVSSVTQIESLIDLAGSREGNIEPEIIWSEMAICALSGAMAINPNPDKICAYLAILLQDRISESVGFKRSSTFTIPERSNLLQTAPIILGGSHV